MLAARGAVAEAAGEPSAERGEEEPLQRPLSPPPPRLLRFLEERQQQQLQEQQQSLGCVPLALPRSSPPPSPSLPCLCCSSRRASLFLLFLRLLFPSASPKRTRGARRGSYRPGGRAMAPRDRPRRRGRQRPLPRRRASWGESRLASPCGRRLRSQTTCVSVEREVSNEGKGGRA